jgi:hypothetical protein
MVVVGFRRSRHAYEHQGFGDTALNAGGWESSKVTVLRSVLVICRDMQARREAGLWKPESVPRKVRTSRVVKKLVAARVLLNKADSSF